MGTEGRGIVTKTFTATTSGTCSACFSRYRPGQKVFADTTGKVKHVKCSATTVNTAVLRGYRF